MLILTFTDIIKLVIPFPNHVYGAVILFLKRENIFFFVCHEINF